MIMKNIRVGLDIGSTTLKAIAIDDSAKPLFTYYERHNADVLGRMEHCFGQLRQKLGEEAQYSICLTGSVAMGVAERQGLDFVQEVVAAAEYVKNFTVDERDMTKYIIGTISNIDQPMTPAGKGDRSMNLYMNHVSEEMIRKERKEILEATESDIRALADIVDAVLACNQICVIGSEEKIEEQKELFKEVREIF